VCLLAGWISVITFALEMPLPLPFAFECHLSTICFKPGPRTIERCIATNIPDNNTTVAEREGPSRLNSNPPEFPVQLDPTAGSYRDAQPSCL